MINRPFLVIVLFIICVIIGYNFGRRNNQVPNFNSFKADTTTRIETIRVVSPPIISTKILKDTIVVHDTILVREQARYVDSMFVAYVSGYRPRLDSIIFRYPQQQIIQYKPMPKHRFHLGPSVGIGLDGAFIGVSLSYSLISF